MATRGRKPVGEHAATARERKAQFDKRMRNAGGEVQGEPRRTACVLYLSDEARSALRRHRDAGKLLKQLPVLDSELVESLLIAYERQRTAGQEADPVLEIGLEVTKLSAPVLDEFQRLRREVLRLTKELAASEASQREMEGRLLARDPEKVRQGNLADFENQLKRLHVTNESLWMHPLANRLALTLREARGDSQRMRTLSGEVLDYLWVLCGEIR